MTQTTAQPRDVNPSPADSPWSIDRSDPDAVLLGRNSADPPQPDDWQARLTASLRAMPGVVAVAAKRYDHEGRLLAMGDFVIHPKGFHHQGQGVDGHAYRFPEPVDVVSGGVLAVDAAAFDQVNGAELLQRPLGAVELCLALLARGGRVVVIPDVAVTDTYSPLSDDQLTADHDRDFAARWQFHWRAADLDALHRAHADTGLLWNLRFHGQAMPFDKYDHRPCMHWQSYADVQPYRQRADHLAKLVAQLTAAAPAARLLDLGCGDGLFAHLFARNGADVTGVDPEPLAIEQAQKRVADEHARNPYPRSMPRFLPGQGQNLPLPDASVDVVAMLDVIEHLPNPVAVLRDVQRVLAPAGHLLVTTPAWQFGHWSDPVYHLCEYTMDQLVAQLHAATDLTAIQTGQITGIYRDLVVVAKKI